MYLFYHGYLLESSTDLLKQEVRVLLISPDYIKINYVKPRKFFTEETLLDFVKECIHYSIRPSY